MTNEEALLLTIDSLKREVDSLRATNRSLNRRANAVESPWRVEVERLKAENRRLNEMWFHYWDRTRDGFDYLGQIYSVCAAKVGLPPISKPYSTVVPHSPFAEKGEPYAVWAWVFPEGGGTRKDYRILDVVRAAIAETQTAPEEVIRDV